MVLAFLVEEVEFVDDLCLAVDRHEVIKIAGLAGMNQEGQKSKIEAGVLQDLHVFDRMDQIWFLKGQVKSKVRHKR